MPHLIGMKIIAFLSLPLVLMSLSLSAQAETRDRTIKEMIQSVQVKASKLDANDDGVLSSQETSRGREKFGMLAGAMENAIDSNNDGVLTVREYVNAQVEEIRRADKDGNGVLTVKEQKRQKQALVMRLLGSG